jgi:Tfp pilus assembly protein PilX
MAAPSMPLAIATVENGCVPSATKSSWTHRRKRVNEAVTACRNRPHSTCNSQLVNRLNDTNHRKCLLPAPLSVFTFDSGQVPEAVGGRNRECEYSRQELSVVNSVPEYVRNYHE